MNQQSVMVEQNVMVEMMSKSRFMKIENCVMHQISLSFDFPELSNVSMINSHVNLNHVIRKFLRNVSVFECVLLFPLIFAHMIASFTLTCFAVTLSLRGSLALNYWIRS